MRYVTFFTLLIIILTFQFLPAQAPDTLWTRTYGIGVGYCVVETSDSGYVMVGKNIITGVYLGLIKINSLGDTIWTKTYGDDNSYNVGYSVRQTDDDGFIIVGQTFSHGSGQEDFWLIKTDEFGDTLWTKTFGGVSSDIGKCVQITNDGGYIVLGTTASYGAGANDAWLIKTDMNGTIQWTKTFGDSSDQNGNCVRQTSDSGYIILGEKGNPSEPTHIFLIKTSSLGDSIWTKTYDGDFANCVQQTPDEGYIFTGIAGRPLSLVKTDSLGDTLWTIHPMLGDGTVGMSVQQTLDGGYIVAGYTIEEDVNPNDRPFILKTNNYGDIMWSNNFSHIHVDSRFNCIQQTYDGGYIATGFYLGGFWLVRFATDPMVLDRKNNIKISEYHLSQNYPNPFNPTTTIRYDLPKTSEVLLKVYNVLGQEVVTLVEAKQSAGQKTVVWDGCNKVGQAVGSGIYIYQIKAGHFVQSRKMMLLR